MINEYIRELNKDKVAIIKAIKDKNRKKLKKINSTVFNDIVNENKTERDKLKANAIKQIEKAQKEEDKQIEKQMPKAKEISFQKVKIPEGINVYFVDIFVNEFFFVKDFCSINDLLFNFEVFIYVTVIEFNFEYCD